MRSLCCLLWNWQLLGFGGKLLVWAKRFNFEFVTWSMHFLQGRGGLHIVRKFLRMSRGIHSAPKRRRVHKVRRTGSAIGQYWRVRLRRGRENSYNHKQISSLKLDLFSVLYPKSEINFRRKAAILSVPAGQWHLRMRPGPRAFLVLREFYWTIFARVQGIERCWTAGESPVSLVGGRGLIWTKMMPANVGSMQFLMKLRNELLMMNVKNIAFHYYFRC